MSNSSPESQNSGGEERLWREFISLELPNGHTFDPIGYMVSCRSGQSLPEPAEQDSWEQLYVDRPDFLAFDMIRSAMQISAGQRITFEQMQVREAMLQSALLIAQTLTGNSEDGRLTGGYVLGSVFWVYFRWGQFDKCREILPKTEMCSQEAREYMQSALADPMGYTIKLINVEDEENK